MLIKIKESASESKILKGDYKKFLDRPFLVNKEEFSVIKFYCEGKIIEIEKEFTEIHFR